MGGNPAESAIKPARKTQPATALASEHRHRGAWAALELADQLMGKGHGHVADFFDRLAAAPDGLGDALMAMGLDAIWIDVEHQGADFAAGSGNAARPDPCRRCGVGHGAIDGQAHGSAAGIPNAWHWF